uniref:Uncharacterized protein n=1 Tax=Moniliophthora roreri TaxID=221103 RepID=A0A0W0FZD3_MONRR
MDPSTESGVDPLVISPDPSLASAVSAEYRRCSVRGCSQALAPDATTKMCSSCREKHRRYATTKRAKRKLEKAAIEGQTVIPVERIPGSTVWTASLGQERSSIRESNTGLKQRKSRQIQPLGSLQAVQFEPTQEPSEETEKLPEAIGSLSDKPSIPLEDDQDNGTLSPNTTWSVTNIDPRLFAAQPSSSELAGALTFSSPASVDSNHTPPNNGNIEPSTSPPRHGGCQLSNLALENGTQESNVSPVQTLADMVDEQVDDQPSAKASGSRRFCSIKGCKSVLESEYSYKMCGTCRDRYRNYGVTKRKKWKAERIAFDHELEHLRRIEDERRAKEGLVPLSESPEELRVWELSIIDEKVQLPPSLAAVLSTAASNAIAVSSPYHPLAIQQLNEALKGQLDVSQVSAPLDQLTPVQLAQLAQLLQAKLDRRATVGPIPLASSTTSPNTAASTSSQPVESNGASSSALTGAIGYPGHAAYEDPSRPGSMSPDSDQLLLQSPLGDREASPSHSTSALPVSASTLVLPQRMCTVSHCHTILPGHYLYKRCDRHRQQNRKHGKLKRAREKVVKGKGPDPEEGVDEGDGIDADAILQNDSEPFDDEFTERQKLEMKAREKASKLMMARIASTSKKSRAKNPKKDEDISASGFGSGEAQAGGADVSMVSPQTEGKTSVAGIIIPSSISGSNHTVNDKRKAYSCTAPSCSNLINPYVKWRMCDTCRTLRKELRLEKKAEEGRQLKEAEAAWERPGGASVTYCTPTEAGTRESGSGESMIHDSAMEVDLPSDVLNDPAISGRTSLPSLSFKSFTPHDVEASHEEEHGTLFGILHNPETDLHPGDGADDFVIREATPAIEIPDDMNSQSINGTLPKLPRPCPNFTPSVPQSPDFVYQPNHPPAASSDAASAKSFTFVQGIRRNKRKSDGTVAASDRPSVTEPNQNQSNDPPGKKQRTRTQTSKGKGKGKVPVQPSMPTPTHPYALATHIPYGSYYPYMAYSPGYALPNGSFSGTLPPGYPYGYPYPGYPGYHYQGYPFATTCSYPPTTAYSPPRYVTPTPAAPSIDSVDSPKTNKKPQNASNEQSQPANSTKPATGSELREESQTTFAPEDANQAAPEIAADVPNTEQLSPQAALSAAPSPTTTGASISMFRVSISTEAAITKTTRSKKAKPEKDIFTHILTPENARKRPRRSTPLFENAEQRLKQIQASLARSSSDSEQTSPAESSSSSSSGLRMMFYRPRPPENFNGLQKEAGSDSQQTNVTQNSFIVEQPQLPPAPEPVLQRETEQDNPELRILQGRTCKGKSCQRAIPSGVPGWFCERCRAKIKNHQAKTKQRFKLEPLKKLSVIKKPADTKATMDTQEGHRMSR